MSDRWQPGDEIPEVPSISGVGRWRSYDTDLCTACGLEFDDGGTITDGVLRDHLDAEHPRQCHGHSCSNIAAYGIGAGFTYGPRCAACAYELASRRDPPPFSAWYWLPNTANADAPRLPEDHPVEIALAGLYEELVADGGVRSNGYVLEVHVYDDETAEAFRRLFEHHPAASMWRFDRYAECDGCGEEKRITQGGCCRECMEDVLRTDGGVPLAVLDETTECPACDAPVATAECQWVVETDGELLATKLGYVCPACQHEWIEEIREVKHGR